MSRPRETLFDNDAWAAARPRLSVLIPFLRDDPSRLLAALDREALDGQAEIVVLDDGSADEALAEAVRAAVSALALPVRFVRLSANIGRARGRNRLATHARGEWYLFLDSDMLPDAPAFLAAYLSLIETEAPAVVFGGFSVRQAPQVRAHALHRRMALKSDCAPAEVRRTAPEKHVFTSNLLVRREVFETEAFDEGFAGWGWEDVEWAMRVARRHRIGHIDNTATHLGLDPARTIAAKYEQSAANFARVVARHREVVEHYPSYRAARLLKRVPLRGAWRPALKAIALAEAAPLAARAFAMRLYRAALYAEAV
ncbi:MAG: glycosyltransferase family A protein [Caulobacteraceae bacterium]|nr:glycosyltransferase family A protein [Caulobacteraceae bacterium]